MKTNENNTKFQVATSFEYIDGEIYIVLKQLVWGEELIEKRKVTDNVMSVVDDYLDNKLGLHNYKS